jgi:hypothetical protein
MKEDRLCPEEIKEANEHISAALEMWQDVMLQADAGAWAYYLDYTDKDLLNALYIFNHIAQNIAIKKGHFNEGNIEDKMARFREGIKEGFGFDTVELTNKVLGTNGRK